MMESILKSVTAFLVFCVCLHVVGCQLTDPQSQAVATNDTVFLTCGLMEATFTQWFNGKTVIPNESTPVQGSEDDTITVIGGSASLAFLSIFPFKASTHAGKYFCLVGLKGMNAIHTCPAELSHAKISHTFHKEPRNTSVTVGATAVLECQPPDSNPAPLIRWRRDGSHLHDNDSRVVVLPTGNLYLLNVSLEDAGSYRCIATNPVTHHRRHSKPAVLTVTNQPLQVDSTQPTLTVYSNTTEVREGEEALLECAGEGVPIPTATWFRLSSLGQELEILPTGTLRIAPASPSDSGKYVCFLQNGGGVASIEITLRVKAAPRVTITPSHPPPYTSNADLTLNCSFTGTEPATVLWYKGTTNLTLQENEVSGSLPVVLDLSNPSTKGIYQCLAYSTAGCAHAEFNVTIQELEDPQGSGDDPVTPSTVTPITVTVTPITVTVDPASLTLNPGAKVTIICTAVGGTDLEIYWSFGGEVREGQRLDPNGVAVNVLEIDTPGVYTCVVVEGLQITTAMLTVEARDTPPPVLTINSPSLDVTVGGSTNFTCIVDQPVSLEWEFEGHTHPATKYTTSQNGTVSVLVLETVIATDHGRYICRANGSFGSIFEDVFLRVRASPPLLMPRNLLASWTPDSRVLVTWQAPESSSLPSPLFGYKLNWDPPAPASHSAVKSFPLSILSYALEDLDLRTRYTILVWAYSNGGDGPPATFVLEPLLAPPPPGPQLSITHCSPHSPTSAQVNWQLSSGDIFADSLDFQMSFTCEEASATGHVTTQPGVDNLQHLLPSCNYQVTVTALLREEPVAQSSACEFVTPEGEVEIDFQLQRLSPTSVQLTLILPSGLTAEGAGLEVDYGEGFRPVLSEVLTLTDLDPSREYSLELRLNQEEWEGSASFVIPEATPSDDELSSRELGLLYGAIFGTVVLACVVIVLFILVLKYVQMNRRAVDKETNHREKQLEVFQRMSCSRSSTLSIKKAPPPMANGVTHL